jgi:hypothetical protein
MSNPESYSFEAKYNSDISKPRLQIIDSSKHLFEATLFLPSGSELAKIIPENQDCFVSEIDKKSDIPDRAEIIIGYTWVNPFSVIDFEDRKQKPFSIEFISEYKKMIMNYRGDCAWNTGKNDYVFFLRSETRVEEFPKLDSYKKI